jgi:hypothetical protein
MILKGAGLRAHGARFNVNGLICNVKGARRRLKENVFYSFP